MSYRSIAVATLLVATSFVLAAPPTTRPANPLEQRLSDVDTAGRTLKQVLTDLAQQTHLKIVADWPKLNAAGVDPARALKKHRYGTATSRRHYEPGGSRARLLLRLRYDT